MAINKSYESFLLEEKDGKVARLKAVLSENALAVEDMSELVTSSDN